MSFTQTMIVQAGSADQLVEIAEGWHRDQAGVAPGYQGARILADKDRPGTYLLEVDFSSEEEAQQNNARSETESWARQLQEVVQGQPEYRNYEVAYTTG